MPKEEYVIGLGNDAVEVEELERVISCWSDKFISRIFTEQEKNYCLSKKQPAIHLAGHFAAKEAVKKAVGEGTCWKEVEVCHNENGKPQIRLTGKMKLLADGIGIRKIMVSISHTKRTAYVVAIALGILDS